MHAFARPLLVLSFALAGGAALAAGSSAPFAYTPDPALRTESVGQLQARVRRACDATQARVQNVSTRQVSRGCGCYASAVMRSLDSGEGRGLPGHGRVQRHRAQQGARRHRPVWTAAADLRGVHRAAPSLANTVRPPSSRASPRATAASPSG